MTALSIQVPYQIFADSDGTPLDNGYVWIGTTNLDPRTNPINVYFDAALTQVAPNPLRTVNGYVYNAGSPAQLYIDGVNFSIRVEDKKSVLVYSFPSGSGISPNANGIVYNPAGTGAVATTVQSKLRESVSVKDFGAVGDGVTDDLTNLQIASDYCKTNGYTLQGASGNFRVTGTWTIECNADLKDMTIKADGATVAKAVQIGPATPGQYLFDADIVCPFVINTSKTVAGWVGFESSIGIEIANVYQSRITVPSVYNFGIGLKEGGYGVGCVYNTITIGVLFGNKINHLLQPGSATGWVNQNTHIGGRFAYSATEGDEVAGVTQIKCRTFDAATNLPPDMNVWINTSIEGSEPAFHLDIQGRYNQFINPRLETFSPIDPKINWHADSASQTTANMIIGGYILGQVTTFTGAGTSNANQILANRANGVMDFSGNGYNVRNTTANNITAPHFQGFQAANAPNDKDASSTDWTYRIYADGFSVKNSASTVAKVNVDASGYVFFGPGSSALVGGFRYNVAGPAITCNYAFAPDADNTTTLGTATRRWSGVYAGNATINTSDAREKQQVRTITDKEHAVAVRCKSLIRAFKFNDAVAEKGDNARIHFGVMAQDIADAFADEGLDASNYSLFCYDEWTELPEMLEEDGSIQQEYRAAGNRYGIRYEELLAFIIASL